MCEGQVTINGLARQCPAHATVHLHLIEKPPGRSVQRIERHLCAACAVDQGLPEAARNGALTAEQQAVLSNAALYGPMPVAHPYEPPIFSQTDPSTWRCRACGHPEGDRYHTHVIERARVLREQALLAQTHVVLVDDPHAAMRACTEAFAARPVQIAVGHEERPIDRQRRMRRELEAARLVLEERVRAWALAPVLCTAQAGELRAALADVDAARARVQETLA